MLGLGAGCRGPAAAPGSSQPDATAACCPPSGPPKAGPCSGSLYSVSVFVCCVNGGAWHYATPPDLCASRCGRGLAALSSTLEACPWPIEHRSAACDRLCRSRDPLKLEAEPRRTAQPPRCAQNPWRVDDRAPRPAGAVAPTPGARGHRPPPCASLPLHVCELHGRLGDGLALLLCLHGYFQRSPCVPLAASTPPRLPAVVAGVAARNGPAAVGQPLWLWRGAGRRL